MLFKNVQFKKYHTLVFGERKSEREGDGEREQCFLGIKVKGDKYFTAPL